jgi:hypothetical protein
MSGFEPSSDDVVWMDQSSILVTNNATFKIDQLKRNLRERMGTATIVHSWMGDGVKCELLKASTGKGWQKGKIRIRFEFVPDEPEPSPDTNFLDDLRKDISPEQ